MNDTTAMKARVRRVVPVLAAAAATVSFASLGFWQLDRAAEKQALADLYSNEAPYRTLRPAEQPARFERVQTAGRLLGDRQILIDNIVKDGRLGYYVITPLEIAATGPLLLVNRGWMDRDGWQAGDVSLDVAGERAAIRGRTGILPRAGLRGGDAFANNDTAWPKTAVFPTREDVEGQLGRPVLPFVLLLSADDGRGFVRDWQPAGMGPMTHYGYAFQWFAMALTVVLISGWYLSRRGTGT